MGNRSKLLLVTIIFVLSTFSAFGQEDDLFREKNDRWGVIFSVPEGYEGTEVKASWGANASYDHRLSALFDRVLLSEDGNCAILYPTVLISLMPQNVCSIGGRMRYFEREMQEAFRYVDEDHNATDPDTVPFSLEDHSTCVTGEFVKKAFNADKMYMYSIPAVNAKLTVSKGEISSEELARFTTATRLFILKEGGYYCDLLLLLSEEGEKQIWEYVDDLAGHLWFDEKQILLKWERI